MVAVAIWGPEHEGPLTRERQIQWFKNRFLINSSKQPLAQLVPYRNISADKLAIIAKKVKCSLNNPNICQAVASVDPKKPLLILPHTPIGLTPVRSKISGRPPISEQDGCDWVLYKDDYQDPDTFAIDILLSCQIPAKLLFKYTEAYEGSENGLDVLGANLIESIIEEIKTSDRSPRSVINDYITNPLD